MMKKYQALLVAWLVASLVLTGCANTTANPVPVAQVGDETRSCQSLSQEIQQMQMLINNSESAASQQTTKNVALGAAGVFFIIPWFFMDLGNAPKLERKAAQTRLERLYMLYSDRGCQAPEPRAKRH